MTRIEHLESDVLLGHLAGRRWFATGADSPRSAQLSSVVHTDDRCATASSRPAPASSCGRTVLGAAVGVGYGGGLINPASKQILVGNLLSPEKYTLPVGLRTYVFQFDQAWEKLTAGAMLVTIPAVLVFLFAQRYLVSGLTRGGVKG